jgi:hypothetical protein
LIILVLIGACVVIEIESEGPVHYRRDATIRQLKTIAAEVNEYKKKHGRFPQSLQEIDVPTGADSFRLLLGKNNESFYVVADRVYEEANFHFHYACDEKIELQKLPEPLPQVEVKKKSTGAGQLHK